MKNGPDIFRDARDLVGCEYISDLHKHREDVKNILPRLPYGRYTADSVKDFMIYIFSERK